MATSPGDESTTASDDHDVIADAVQTQLSHISTFDRWLLHRIRAEEDRSGVVSRVKGRLDCYREWILEVEKASRLVSDYLESWSMDACIRPDSGRGIKIIVTGPGSGEPLEISANDVEEAKDLMGDKNLGYMISVCGAFAEAQTAMLSLLQTVKEMDLERLQLSQPAEVTVQTHIRRLAEYNDMKDIAQQLIGLVAENRGVRIGTLYESGEFGVTADD